MTDPKNTTAKPAVATAKPTDAPKAAATVSQPPVVADDEPVVLPKPSLSAGASVTGKPVAAPAAGLSSVGAELAPDANVVKVAGVETLDAGGPYVSQAPDPTPAAAVAYPSTGGLPDTGPNSKYVAGTYTGPELYNRDGQRVNADGQLIDEIGNTIVAASADLTDGQSRFPDRNLMRQDEVMSEATKAEMEAGAARLRSR